jgi:hypothetical protein
LEKDRTVLPLSLLLQTVHVVDDPLLHIRIAYCAAFTVPL